MNTEFVSSLPSKTVFIAGEGGRLYHYDLVNNEINKVFQEEHQEALMGITRDGDTLFVGSDSQLFKFRILPDRLEELSRSKKFSGRKLFINYKLPNFHQMSLTGDQLYMSVTRMNEVWKFNRSLNLIEQHKIRPPYEYLPALNGWNYNHLNHVYPHDGKFYVTLNWFSGEQYGYSGVGIFDEEFNEIERRKYGWEMHSFTIQNDHKIGLCASSGGIKDINHPHRAGVMVDSEMVFEHDPEKYFNKDYAYSSTAKVLVGGEIDERKERIYSDAVVTLLNNDYNTVRKETFPEAGGFRGVEWAPDTMDEIMDGIKTA